MKETAEAYLGETVSQAVITVPAYFNDSPAPGDQGCRQDRRAGSPAHHQRADRGGACLWAGAQGHGGTIAVYDLGGGTFDVFDPGDRRRRVRGEVDQRRHAFWAARISIARIIDFLADEFKKDQGIDLRNDKLALQRLKEAAEKAKIELSSSQQTDVNLPFITADQPPGPKHLNIKLTRAKLEQLVDDLVQRTIEPCRKALADAGR